MVIMEKDEILQIEKEISGLKKQLMIAKIQYLGDNKIFGSGDPVFVETPKYSSFMGGNGFIYNAYLSDDLSVAYSVLKEKKDGKSSKMFMDLSHDKYCHIAENRISKREVK